MLMQLIQEQDVYDRENIGLFGVRKNQELVGVNQGAMSNIFDRRKQTVDPTSSPSNGLASAINKDASSHKDQSGAWDLSNKNMTYGQVVAAKSFITKRKMSELEKMLPLNKLGLSSEAKDLTTRTLSPMNNLQVSRDCATCHGFAPQILSQIKLACLSYVSSPIQYNKDVSLKINDMIRIKEKLLQKVESQYAVISQMLCENKSNYTMLEEDDKAQQSKDVDTLRIHDSMIAQTDRTNRT